MNSSATAVILSLSLMAQAKDFLMPGVATFLASHSEWGTPKSVQDTPDWAEGKRQRVDFSSGRSLLFYLKDGRVVTVLDEQRQKIWGEQAAPKPPPAAVDKPAVASSGIPAYRILYSGPHRRPGKPMGKRGDVMISSLTRKSPPAEVEAICVAIAKKEGFTSSAFYATEEAYRANESSDYLKQHPQALIKGFLGSIGGSLTDPKIEEGVWTSGEVTFPDKSGTTTPPKKSRRK